MLDKLTIAFIGAGTMGEAMIAGLLREQLVPRPKLLRPAHAPTAAASWPKSMVSK